MKNFHIDMVLKILTVFSYIVVYSVVGYSAISVLRTSRDTDSTKSHTIQIPATTINPTESTSSLQTEAAEKNPDPTPAQESVSSTNPTETPDSRCLVSVDGASYDVTQFRTIHDGGDIFICGTDMTKSFYDEHDTRTLQKLQRYKI